MRAPEVAGCAFVLVRVATVELFPHTTPLFILGAADTMAFGLEEGAESLVVGGGGCSRDGEEGVCLESSLSSTGAPT